MNNSLMWIIAAFGLIALIGVFIRMKPGFGPFNLRVVGIILVGTFSALLALKNAKSCTAAISILGAIAGYLFGIKENQ